MTIDEVDEAFNRETSETSKKLEQPNHQARPEPSGHSISFDEWRWRAADKMLDQLRKEKRQRPISDKVRKAQLEAYLLAVSKVEANQETEEF